VLCKFGGDGNEGKWVVMGAEVPEIVEWSVKRETWCVMRDA
jgi:hypothetical protein